MCLIKAIARWQYLKNIVVRKKTCKVHTEIMLPASSVACKFTTKLEFA